MLCQNHTSDTCTEAVHVAPGLCLSGNAENYFMGSSDECSETLRKNLCLTSVPHTLGFQFSITELKKCHAGWCRNSLHVNHPLGLGPRTLGFSLSGFL